MGKRWLNWIITGDPKKEYEIQHRITPEVEDYISYAVKEGYLDEDTAREMTAKQKEDYYNECL